MIYLKALFWIKEDLVQDYRNHSYLHTPIQKIWTESDNKNVTGIDKQPYPAASPTKRAVSSVKNLLAKRWTCLVVHGFKAGNHLAGSSLGTLNEEYFPSDMLLMALCLSGRNFKVTDHLLFAFCYRFTRGRIPKDVAQFIQKHLRLLLLSEDQNDVCTLHIDKVFVRYLETGDPEDISCFGLIQLLLRTLTQAFWIETDNKNVIDISQLPHLAAFPTRRTQLLVLDTFSNVILAAQQNPYILIAPLRIRRHQPYDLWLRTSGRRTPVVVPAVPLEQANPTTIQQHSPYCFLLFEDSPYLPTREEVSINQFISYKPCTIGTLVPAAIVSVTGKRECETYNEALEAKPLVLLTVTGSSNYNKADRIVLLFWRATRMLAKFSFIWNDRLIEIQTRFYAINYSIHRELYRFLSVVSASSNSLDTSKASIRGMFVYTENSLPVFIGTKHQKVNLTLLMVTQWIIKYRDANSDIGIYHYTQEKTSMVIQMRLEVPKNTH
ncbi:hypothetical protein CLF_102125 [Clonorchis sinensis]|uniref:Uncharacterized protein n=1 Tax=Clonorchis sinensis TaxID=79923 RepID=G7Y7C6_CLOSI|nr:hypothetical protein CLF_102125 [Clonorchis sinensis]